MKTIKSLFFSMATLVALSVSFTSCDAISDALAVEKEVEAPAIDFNIGGAAAAPMQKVKLANGETKIEYEWINRDINFKSELEAKLKEQNLTLENVKTLIMTQSYMQVVSGARGDLELGTVIIYINDNKVAESQKWAFMYNYPNSPLQFAFEKPFPIFELLALGTFRLRIVSDKQAPSYELKMKLINTYKAKVSALKSK